jgi:Ran GTPase-activating protein (RanGAP) involved in mRNA processing and transport
VAALAAAPALGTLARLALSDNELGPGAGAPLAELLGRAGKLRVLELAGTRLGEEGAA